MSALAQASLRVDLWLAPESRTTPASLAACREWLSADEAAQWQRFRREEDRDRYLLARGLVRGVLADQVGLPPASLAFARQPGGKPLLLRTSPSMPLLHFNLSHTRGLVALAVCREAEVGVDVEAVDPRIEPQRFAARQLSAPEREMLAATSGARRHERFFELWTLKEAYLKALGEGLARDPDSFSVLLDDEPPRIADPLAADHAAACQCRLYTPLAGYRLALAVRDAVSALDVRFAGELPLPGFAPK